MDPAATQTRPTASGVSEQPSKTNRAVLFSLTGQSNALGGGRKAFPRPLRCVTREPPYPENALTIEGGVGPIFRKLKPLDASALGGLVPAAETRDGESPVTSALRWLIRADIADRRPAPIFVGEAHGAGGRKLREIGPGTVVYQNGLLLWQTARKLLSARGLRAWCPALHLDQGEADRGVTKDADWVDTLAKLRSQAETDLRAIFDQAEPVWTVMMQTSCPSSRAPGALTAGPARAQLRAMLNLPRTTIAMPAYWLRAPFGMAGSHFSALRHALRGEYHAKANRIIRRALEEAVGAGRDPWRVGLDEVRTCLRPDVEAMRRNGRVVEIPLVLPDGAAEVVVDTASLPPAPNLGFTSIGPEIEGVELRGDLRTGYAICVSLRTEAPVTLRYAVDQMGVQQDRSSSWGNFRTNSLDNSIAVPGLQLHDWLVVFEASFP